MIAAATCFAILDTTGKYLTQTYHVLEVAWGRYFFSGATMLLLMPRYGVVRPFVSRRPGLQVVRALLLMVVSIMFFTAVSYLPLVDMIAITYAAPLILTGLAHFVLHERVGPRRWTAVAVGFIGVLVVIRPGFAGMHWASLLALVMAAGNACYMLMTRMLAGIDPAMTTLYYTGLVGALGMTLIVPFVWTGPTLEDWLLLAVMGLGAAVGHYLLILAYNRAQASVLAPYSYASMISIVILGYLVFGTFPDAMTILGTTIIIGSGIYIFTREAYLRRVAREAQTPK